MKTQCTLGLVIEETGDYSIGDQLNSNETTLARTVSMEPTLSTHTYSMDSNEHPVQIPNIWYNWIHADVPCNIKMT